MRLFYGKGNPTIITNDKVNDNGKSSGIHKCTKTQFTEHYSSIISFVCSTQTKRIQWRKHKVQNDHSCLSFLFIFKMEMINRKSKRNHNLTRETYNTIRLLKIIHQLMTKKNVWHRHIESDCLVQFPSLSYLSKYVYCIIYFVWNV